MRTVFTAPTTLINDGTILSLNITLPVGPTIPMSPALYRYIHIGSALVASYPANGGDRPCVSSASPGVYPTSFTLGTLSYDTLAFDLRMYIYNYHDYNFFSRPFTVPNGAVAALWTFNGVDRTIAFDTTSTYQTALNTLYANMRMGATNDLVQKVYLASPDYERWIYNVLIDTTTISNCPGVTVTTSTTTPAVTEYLIPVGVTDLYSDGTAMSTSKMLRVQKTNQIQSISYAPTSRYRYTVTLPRMVVSASDCGDIAQARLLVNVTVSYSGIPVGYIVGPRTIADVATKPSNAAAGSVWNAYFDTLSNFVGPTCVNGVCSFNVLIQTECRILQTDGNTFRWGNYSNSTQRIAAYGTAFNYSSSLDMHHDLWVDVYSRNGTDPTTTTTTRIVIDDVGGSWDRIGITADIHAYPLYQLNSIWYESYAGLLPLAHQTTVSNVPLLMYVPQTYNVYVPATPILYLNETRNRALTFGGVLAPVVWINPTLWNTKVSIEIVYTTISLTPISTTGETVSASLNYHQIAPIMTHVSREIQQNLCTSNCRVLPIVQANSKGIDGFSIPTISLAQLIPVTFEGVTISFNYIIQSYDSIATLSSHQRRLMEAGDVIVYDNAVVYRHQVNVYFDESSTQALAELAAAESIDADASNNAPSWQTLYVGLSGLCGIVLLGVGIAACALHRLKKTIRAREAVHAQYVKEDSLRGCPHAIKPIVVPVVVAASTTPTSTSQPSYSSLFTTILQKRIVDSLPSTPTTTTIDDEPAVVSTVQESLICSDCEEHSGLLHSQEQQYQEQEEEQEQDQAQWIRPWRGNHLLSGERMRIVS
jgi:hypothetical protein